MHSLGKGDKFLIYPLSFIGFYSYFFPEMELMQVERIIKANYRGIE